MKTVLVVDDSAFMRNSIIRCLGDANIRVVGEAENGKVAVEKYIEIKPDIVTLDLAMLEYDGIEALKDIKQHDPNAKVIVVSSITDQESIAAEAMALGAYKILNKPINKDDLLATIDEIINI